MTNRTCVLFMWYSPLALTRSVTTGPEEASHHGSGNRPRAPPGAHHDSIFIPDSAQEKPQEGRVIAIGTGKVADDGTKIPLAVKAGDRILFGKYSGSEVKLDGTEYLIMKE